MLPFSIVSVVLLVGPARAKKPDAPTVLTVPSIE